jgi:hypothetical protein
MYVLSLCLPAFWLFLILQVPKLFIFAIMVTVLIIYVFCI